jgi:predicted nucleotidyltransferase
LQDDLRKLDFKHDMDGPNCRFILHGLKVDVMPSEGRILGFTNSWYDYAIKTAVEYVLPDGTSIRLVSAPAFIATKLEAFYDRGKGDVHMSHDLEDIIAVVNGRAELMD